MRIIEFLNQYNGALMVIITAIYVAATIAICNANISSASASKEQLEESKRQFKKQLEESKRQFKKQLEESKHQFDETRRLEVMPYLQFEFFPQSTAERKLNLALVSEDIGGGSYITVFRLKNIGHGTAKDITYTYVWQNGSHDKGTFPIRALQNGDEQFLKIDFAMPKEKYDKIEVSFVLSFMDLLENRYTQKIQIEFGNNPQTKHFDLLDYTTYSPVAVEKEQTNA